MQTYYFLTKLDKVEFEEGYSIDAIKASYDKYLESRSVVYSNKERDMSLMDIATIAMKELRKMKCWKTLMYLMRLMLAA